jgi:hypothetical protein
MGTVVSNGFADPLSVAVFVDPLQRSLWIPARQLHCWISVNPKSSGMLLAVAPGVMRITASLELAGLAESAGLLESHVVLRT